MESPAGVPLGSGLSCVQSVEGCQFAAGCRDTVRATFTLDFAGGSITAPVVLKEKWQTDTILTQRTKGRISSGTGAFAGAKGSIKCGGSLEFVGFEIVPDLVCTVHTKSDDDD